MLFPSFAFLVFLPIVFLLYWYATNRDLRVQNLFILLASYLFYGWWDARFLALLIGSSLVDFFLALAIDRSDPGRRKKTLLVLSLVVNLGVLALFKYFNFFRDGLEILMHGLGMRPDLPTLHLILPIGISFYTFQSLSYTIDVYRGRLKATPKPVEFLAFVSLFPQLVAGPIERAVDLLPQFQKPRRFDRSQATDGLRQMLWGFFKKMVIADGCGPIVDGIFDSPVDSTPGLTLFFGAFFFAFQIYGDFSGYSDIAIGCARLFGFQLSRNFAYPYFSRDIPEFWRRWHISLSSWFRDNVYMPLGGWRNKMGRFRNIMITFAVSGLWHGANWTFVSWGVLHGAYYLPTIIRDGRARRDDPGIRDLPAIVTTFLLVVVTWVFFRAPGVAQALAYLKYMLLHAALHPGIVLYWLKQHVTWLIAAMLLLEWKARHRQHALASLPRSIVLRWGIYTFITLLIILYMDVQTTHEFIYFQF